MLFLFSRRKMSTDREEILENFMVVTRIKNVEEAIIWLDYCDWDLKSAIEISSPEEVKLQNDAYRKRRKKDSSPEPQDLEQNGVQMVKYTSDLRVIQIYVVHGTSVHMVRAPHNITLHSFKRLISFITDVPPCQQVITGWNREPMSDTEALSSMADQSFVTLKDSLIFSNEMEVEDETVDIYHFNIIDETHNRIYDLKVPTNYTVAQVKRDSYLLTEIPIENQSWNGWPEGNEDFMEINCLILEKPVHSLKVRTTDGRSEMSVVSSTEVDCSEDIIEAEKSSDVFSVDDEDFSEIPSSIVARPRLIPNTVEGEMAGSVHFVDAYLDRYGRASPNFLTGTLEDAMKEAYRRPAWERKMLALYLHHDDSVLSNVFCTELLGAEATLKILSDYFVVWGWDVTEESTRTTLISSVTRTFGNSLAGTIDAIPTDSFPALFIIAQVRSQYELLNIIYGNNGIGELLSTLVNSVDLFNRNIADEAREEEEREARQKIKNEQDSAFEQSLEMDRAKEEAKRKRLLEKSLAEERKRKEQEMEDLKRMAEVAVVESTLPPEPPEEEESSAYSIFTFKFRTPTGQTFDRRFRSSDTLVVVFNFLFVKGYDIEEFKFITGWPRKDLTVIDPQTVLGDLGIFTQETIILEAR